MTQSKAMRRELAKSYMACDQIIAALYVLNEAFSKQHPEYCKLIEPMVQMTIMLQDAVLAFWRLAWGEPPANIANWYNPADNPPHTQ